MSDSARAHDIEAILDDLIRQRRRMPATDPGLLEANRLSIVYWQWQLSLARAREQVRDAAA